MPLCFISGITAIDQDRGILYLESGAENGRNAEMRNDVEM